LDPWPEGAKTAHEAVLLHLRERTERRVEAEAAKRGHKAAEAPQDPIFSVEAIFRRVRRAAPRIGEDDDSYRARDTAFSAEDPPAHRFSDEERMQAEAYLAKLEASPITLNVTDAAMKAIADRELARHPLSTTETLQIPKVRIIGKDRIPPPKPLPIGREEPYPEDWESGVP
jgi:hypothetical protein